MDDLSMTTGWKLVGWFTLGYGWEEFIENDLWAPRLISML